MQYASGYLRAPCQSAPDCVLSVYPAINLFHVISKCTRRALQRRDQKSTCVTNDQIVNKQMIF